MLVIVAAMERELRAMRRALSRRATETNVSWLVTGVVMLAYVLAQAFRVHFFWHALLPVPQLQ